MYTGLWAVMSISFSSPPPPPHDSRYMVNALTSSSPLSAQASGSTIDDRYKMPLRVADATVTPEALKEAKETYLIFYSSPDSNGRLWCPDCRDVEGLVKGTFEPKDGPSGVIVYVGQKAEWKTPANAFRGEPWRVTGVPTIIKLRDSVEVARLVDNEITSRLTSFVEE